MPHLLKKNFLKKWMIGVLPALILPVVLLCCLDIPFTQSQRFSHFTQSLFCQELSDDTLALHYTLADPAAYSLDDCPISLGNGSLQGLMQEYAACENYAKRLNQFETARLTEKQKLTWEILNYNLEQQLSAKDLLLYQEPLGPTLGIQAQLSILFAEYEFRTRKDIETYLNLLTQMPDYFNSILSFEQEKAAAGLFMSKDNARAVISQCQDFCADPDDHFLMQVFDEKIEPITNLTADEKIAFQNRNRSILAAYVLPAYQSLADGLQKLLPASLNDKGLYYFPNGTSYYEYLIHSQVGDDRPVAEIEEAIKQQMVADFSTGKQLQQQMAGSTSDKMTANAKETDDISTTAHTSAPENMLSDLRTKLLQDFPLPVPVSCQIKYVHSSLQNYLSPAFYLTPAIDQYQNNVIYINPAGNYQGLSLYTTLAHEGYPGHLYQSVFFQAQSPDPIRSLLGTKGYVEGWATYVEMYAYQLWDSNSLSSQFEQKNRSFTLGLASLLDIGIHYHGYTREQVYAFLSRLGFSETSSDALYDSILQAPGNYLNYYVGCLNFYRLRDYYQELKKEQFSLKEFHERVLQIGPAPFSILKKELSHH